MSSAPLDRSAGRRPGWAAVRLMGTAVALMTASACVLGPRSAAVVGSGDSQPQRVAMSAPPSADRPRAAALSAEDFSVRIEAIEAEMDIAGVARLEPSLVPLRDAMVDRLRRTLAENWKRATRGLSTLTVTAQQAEIVLFVAPARGSSFHGIAPTGARRIVLYVVGSLGDSVEYFDAGTLHELGHLWCCYGPEASSDGHWSERTADAGLLGVDRFGLMASPMECRTQDSVVLRCPHLFSERELRTMGFEALPPASVDPCERQAAALREPLGPLDGAIAISGAEIDRERAAFAALVEQIRAIERLYPSGVVPPDVRARYDAYLVAYDIRRLAIDRKIDTHNDFVTTRNDLVRQLFALHC